MCTVLCKPIKIDIDGDYPRRGSGSSVPGVNRIVDGVLPVGLGSRPTLLTGGLDVVPVEAYHGARVRPDPAAC